MPATPHTEKHFNASETVRDVVIGMSDGLTVPFALAAGLTGAVARTHLVVIAGLAIYLPTIYIRKTNKMLKVLEQIEANTRK